MTLPTNDRSSLTRFAWLSVAAAIATMGLKVMAYWLTSSVGLLSDALESGVNLFGALMALAMLAIAARPADESHAYGHGKAEYFSSGVEGTLILVAAGSIAFTAIKRFLDPQPLEQVSLGLAISVVASLINLGVALVLHRAAKTHESITLEANARHLMTDVWTSVGVLVGVGAVVLTGWIRLDPIIALIVAANITWSGFQIVRDSVKGLMDSALPISEQAIIQQVLEPYRNSGIEFHALRTRISGARRFISVHVLVPGNWSIQKGHELVEEIEGQIRSEFTNVTVFTHLEPLDDPVSWEDVSLDRTGSSVSVSESKKENLKSNKIRE